ncbi:MAG: hypothetical protein ACKV2T_39025 [Kofleriaceae bacterium]
MANARWIVVAVVAVAVIQAGCEPPSRTRADVEKAWGAQLRARMAELVTIGQVARDNEVVGNVRILRAAEAGGPVVEKVEPSDIDVDYNDDKHTGNSIIVQLDDLADMAADASPIFRFAELMNLRMAKMFAGVPIQANFSDSMALLEPAVKHVVEAKYVLVVNPMQTKMPIAGVGASDYTPGAAQATVVLVEVAGAKHLGGITVHATSSAEIRVSGQSFDAVQGKLDKDLGAQLGKAISDGIRMRWTNAQAPYNWGLGW